MIQKSQIQLATHGYFFLTLIGFSLWAVMFDTYFIHLFGCHTTIYLFLTSLLILDFGAIIMARALMLIWPVYILSFLVCYLFAVKKKKYLPLAVIASVDVLFSCFVSLRYLQMVMLPEFLTCLIGTFFSFLTAKWLFLAYKQEKVPMVKEFVTNT